jgi:hypothetical protein
VAGTATSAAQTADVVLLMLSDSNAIHEALLHKDGVAALADTTVLQMGTIGPDESRNLATIVAAAGGEYIEAPVLGSQPEALKGTLLLMVGCQGKPEDSRAWPVLTALGHEPLRVGEARFHQITTDVLQYSPFVATTPQTLSPASTAVCCRAAQLCALQSTHLHQIASCLWPLSPAVAFIWLSRFEC